MEKNDRMQVLHGASNCMATKDGMKLSKNVCEVVQGGRWNTNRLRELLPEELADHIQQHIKPPVDHGIQDKPFWMLETRGDFSVKSAWEYVRRRKEPCNACRMIWVKGLPFKIPFFMWKVWKNKLPLDEFFKRLGYLMASRCWCCVQPEEETLTHFFPDHMLLEKCGIISFHVQEKL